jgi:hypothetical protein
VSQRFLALLDSSRLSSRFETTGSNDRRLNRSVEFRPNPVFRSGTLDSSPVIRRPQGVNRYVVIEVVAECQLFGLKARCEGPPKGRTMHFSRLARIGRLPVIFVPKVHV